MCHTTRDATLGTSGEFSLTDSAGATLTCPQLSLATLLRLDAFGATARH